MKKTAFIAAAMIVSALSCGVSAEASLKLGAEPAAEEVMVGDRIVVDITAENTGDTELSDVTIYFEDQPVYEQASLAPGETAQKQIALLAWDEDIDNGGVINISAEAEGIDKVSAVCTVNVIPNDGSIPMPGDAQPSPPTGDSRGILPAAAAAVSALVLIKAQNRRGCAK